MATTRSAPRSPSKKKTRQPRRCTKCPNRPLFSTCPHRFRNRGTSLEGQAGAVACTQVSGPPLQPPPTCPRVESPAPAVTVEHQTTSSIVIDPVLLEEERQVHAMALPQTPVSTGVAGNETGTQLSDQARSPIKRVQPSGVNAIFGYVDGVGRGNEKYRLHRTRELLPPITDQARATRALDRWITDLVSRAESISFRTGAWLYLAVQHPASKTPFIHYASKKLRKEGQAEVEAIHKEVRQAMNTLTRAHKRAVVASEREISEAQTQAKEALERAERAESELEKLKRLIATMKATGPSSETPSLV
ncbi:hypothetical protein CC2G_001703 [Coprinopsis cinerea AmutBmut pab1-1]|nr:hypothetical protein CC2G_001703 [Coprinopsis cinerea AmutBmut pab1-1]